METGEFDHISAASPARKRSRVLLVFAALFLGLLLLSAWFTPTAMAQDASQGPDAVDAPKFDLAITKSKSSNYFTVGSNNLYYINVYRTNGFPVTSTVIVEDAIPSGMTIDGIEATDWNCSLSTSTFLNCRFTKIEEITFTVISLPTIFFTVTVSPDITGTVWNTATILTVDSNPLNNYDTEETPIDSIDLELVKTVKPTVVDISDTITYTMVITNHGPSVASNVVVSDTFSKYLENIVGTAGFIKTTDTTGKWDIPLIAPDDAITLTLSATLKDPDANGQVIKNVAEVSSSNKSDWDTSNNRDEVSFIVGGLEITKTIDKTQAYVGELVTYVITVKNISPSFATQVQATDVFTTGLDIVDYKTTYGSLTYSSTTHKLTNYIGSLAGGSSVVITVKARANSTITTSKTLTNTATVVWNYPQLSATTSEVKFDVIPAAALEIIKDDGVTNILPDQVLTYTVSIKNVGSLVMPQDVVIIDTLPSNAALVNIIRDTLGTLDEITNTPSSVTVTLKQTLDPNEEVKFRIVVRAASTLTTGATVTNLVTLTTPSGAINGNSANNYDIDEDKVNTLTTSGMNINLSLTPVKGKVGTSFTFKIEVKNTGNLIANNVKVTGNLQSILDYVSSTPPSGTSFTPITSGTTRSYTWTIGSMLGGQTRTLTFVYKANATATAADSYEHYATLNWDTTKNLNSNTVKYRILASGSSTLPETGLRGQQKDTSGLANLAMIASALLGLLGAASLGYGLWARHRKPLWATWFVVTGLILLGGGGLFGAASYGFSHIPALPAQELAAIPRGTPAPELPAAPQPQATDFVEQFNSWPAATPDTLPDYPIPTPPPSLNSGPNGNDPDASAVTRIIIPGLGLDTVVKYVPYSDSTWLIGGLKQEIAWMGNTSWPGLGSNTGLAGHVDLANGDSGPFWNLGDLKPGDQITLHTEKNKYIYTMRDTRIVADTDLSVIQPTEKPQLTLITCTNWDTELKMYLHRLVVFADLIAVEPLNQVSLNN